MYFVHTHIQHPHTHTHSFACTVLIPDNEYPGVASFYMAYVNHINDYTYTNHINGLYGLFLGLF